MTEDAEIDLALHGRRFGMAAKLTRVVRIPSAVHIVKALVLRLAAAMRVASRRCRYHRRYNR